MLHPLLSDSLPSLSPTPSSRLGCSTLMPSVRVKKGYQHIDDASLNRRPRSRSLAAARPQLGEPLPRTRSWEGNGTATDADRPSLSRARAQSKVSHHIMSTTRPRQVRTSLTHREEMPVAGPSQTHPQNGTYHGLLHRHTDTYSVEGQQAELRVPTEGDQGLEGSQVNLALSRPGPDYDRDESMSPHHHDDIVEHLDVIGASCRLVLGRRGLYCVPTDPQISTVSTLTNAMNAIVMYGSHEPRDAHVPYMLSHRPPLSFYSRKPVVMLPRTRKKRKKADDAEKGKEIEHEDALDQHVEDVLRKRDRFRRVMQGVWSFVKTPLGVCTLFWLSEAGIDALAVYHRYLWVLSW